MLSVVVVARCCCCCCLLLLLLLCFISIADMLLLPPLLVVVVVVAKWGRVRVDFCTLHFKYEHIFVQCTKRGKTKGTKARNDPQLWLQLQLELELQQKSQAGAANTGNMLLLSLEQELNIFRRQKGEAKREKKVEKRR